MLRILKFKHIKSTWIAQLKQDLNHRLMMQQYLKQQQDMQLIQASQASLLPLEEQKVIENIHLLPPSQIQTELQNVDVSIGQILEKLNLQDQLTPADIDFNFLLALQQNQEAIQEDENVQLLLNFLVRK